MSWLRSTISRAAGALSRRDEDEEPSAEAGADGEAPAQVVDYFVEPAGTTGGASSAVADVITDNGAPGVEPAAAEEQEGKGGQGYTRLLAGYAATGARLAAGYAAVGAQVAAEVGGRAAVSALKNMQGRFGGKVEVSIAIEKLERKAKQSRGEARKNKLRIWGQALNAGRKAAEGGGGVPLPAAEADEGAAAAAVPAERASEGSTQLLLKQQVFVDTTVTPPLEFTFREVFLRCAAVENICENFLKVPPVDEEELQLVTTVLGYTLQGGVATAQSVLKCLRSLASNLERLRATQRVSNVDVVDMVRGAVSGLKCNCATETIDSDMERCHAAAKGLLQRVPSKSDLQAAPAEGGTTAISATRLAEGCATTHDIMALSRVVHTKALMKLDALKDDGPGEALADLHAQLQALREGAAVAAATFAREKEEAETQRVDAEGFRAKKMGDMNKEDKELVIKLKQLNGERAVLEAKLATVVASIAEVEQKLSKTQEEQSEFEDANSTLIESLAGRIGEVEAALGEHAVETELLEEAHAFITTMREQQRAMLAAARSGASAAVADATAAVVRDMATHTWFRMEEAGGLLQRMQFCARETSAMQEKQSQMASMGMDGMVAELDAGRLKMAEKYSEAYEDMTATLHVMDALKKDAHAFVEGLSPDVRAAAAVTESEARLQECLSKVEALRAKFQALAAPAMAAPPAAGPQEVEPEESEAPVSPPSLFAPSLHEGIAEAARKQAEQHAAQAKASKAEQAATEQAALEEAEVELASKATAAAVAEEHMEAEVAAAAATEVEVASTEAERAKAAAAIAAMERAEAEAAAKAAEEALALDTAEVARATDTQEAAEAEKVEAELDARMQAKVAADKVVDKAVVEAATETGQEAPKTEAEVKVMEEEVEAEEEAAPAKTSALEGGAMPADDAMETAGETKATLKDTDVEEEGSETKSKNSKKKAKKAAKKKAEAVEDTPKASNAKLSLSMPPPPPPRSVLPPGTSADFVADLE